jgi:hypothetical protein
VRTWERLRVGTLCGACGRQLDVGDPVLVFIIERGNHPTIRRVRCDQCEGPAPPDLPELVVTTHAITPTPLTRLVPRLPLGTPLNDWRKRAAGEREPGQEG